LWPSDRLGVLTELWTGLGGKLADRVAAALFSPSLVFWAVGALAWLASRGGPDTWPAGVREFARRVTAAQTGLRVTVVLAAIAVLILTSRLVGWLTPPALRLMEGYWPSAVAPLRRRLVGRFERRRKNDTERWRGLQRPAEELDATELAELLRLDRRLRRLPLLAQQLMPTRLGNILRASETRPARKYGLDPVVCWPQLWLLLPDTVRGEVSLARARLDSAVATVLWGGLILLWTGWSRWTLLLAVVVAVSGYLAALREAAAFGDLVEAAWDLHRAELYRAVRWPLPGNPAEEYRAGRALTSYLRRGARGTAPTFS
jgi:hypothetical protein